MESIQPYLDYFAANPQWAIVVVFLIAFGEALLIIGLFVPSTAVLVGAGMLVGTGHLPFWPVFWATAIGAILGDQLSYWAGRFFGLRLKTMWPLNRYASLVERGEEFVKNHGGKSIAIGRFVPGVKAVVPGIVGMLNMNQPFFIFVNVTSGLFWAACHVFPGMLLGQGLALAGDLSGRLVVILLVLLVLLGAFGWLTRLLAAGVLAPLTERIMKRASTSVQALAGRPFKRLGRSLDPKHPRSARLLTFGILLFVGVCFLLNLLLRVLLRDQPSNIDQSISTLLSELRNAPADSLMIAVTISGSTVVLLTLCAVMILWLLWHKAWRAALGVASIVAVQQILTFGLKYGVGRQRPPGYNVAALDGFISFPSGHAALATVALGLLAIIASQSWARWSRALMISLAAMGIVLIGFSRVYLGASWPSDVIGGIVLGTMLVAVFGFVLEAFPARRIRPLGMIAVSLAVACAAWATVLGIRFDDEERRYAGAENIRTYTVEDWGSGKWKQEPRRRIDLAGQPEDAFVAQWAGPLSKLEEQLKKEGFARQETWTWKNLFLYLDTSAELAKVPPRPLLHKGLGAKLTAIKAEPGEVNRRLVLRAYKSGVAIASPSGPEPVYLISVLQEESGPRFGLYTMPRLRPASEQQNALTLAALRSGTKDMTALAASGGTAGPGLFVAAP